MGGPKPPARSSSEQFHLYRMELSDSSPAISYALRRLLSLLKIQAYSGDAAKA
jgi:hypothetical protein